MDDDKFRKLTSGLMGMGAWFAGNGPQYQQVQLAQEEQQRKARDMANLDDTRRMIAAGSRGDFNSPMQLLENRVENLKAKGGNWQHSEQSLALLKSNPSEWLRDQMIGEKTMSDALKVDSMFAGAKTGMASAKTTHFDNGTTMLTLPSGVTEVYGPDGEKLEGQARVNALKTARQEQVTHAGDRAAAAELATLKAQLQGKPDVESAVTAAVEAARSDAKKAEEQAVKDVQFGVYEVAFDNFVESIGGTRTGPGMGLLPAFTANAQNMEMAGALLKPAIRAAFRVKGEGAQSDREFQQFMAMVPDRNTRPEVAVKNLATLDKMMRTKFGQPLVGDGSESGSEAQPVVRDWSEL